MKHIFLVFIAVLQLFGGVVKSPIVGLNEELSEASIKVDRIDVGVSGFVVHEIAKGKRIILANAIIKSFDPASKIAKISVSEFNTLSSSALPNGKWSVEVGDEVVLAFGYTRGVLIAPNEEIYYRITKNSALQWVHPDLFAVMLSYNGHPTPLRSDFLQMSNDNSVGLVFVFLQNRVYTLDAKSFKILTITDAALEQGEAQLPFYTRVEEISQPWWKWFDDGAKKLDDYEPHYYELIVKANRDNKELYEIVKSGGNKLKDLLEEFDIKG